ncbi:hypothetical protein [Polyangium aurulentum]|uniref:hypothetical protein n=1 Tax=Polyangium aurulentum TaxID=2567896 RepID=UPI00200EEB87|nr:hypothetical protein [Polyangium aurulentum]UQA56123.1 hypothetical protein E8A73_033080 [Polyangium aurulentum]
MPPKLFWSVFDDAVLAPVWLGDDDRGTLYTPLWRGCNGAIEDLVYAPPDGDCRKIKGTARVDWDKAANTVHFTIKFRGVPPSPTIHRTEGVDFWYNPFHTRPKDLLSTGYRIWSISPTEAAPNATFYYDASTFLLLGSQYDFPQGPPPDSIAVPLRVYTLASSDLMFPDAQGNLVYQYAIPYDHITQEGGATGHIKVGILPHDLCQSNPSDPTAGQLRIYISPWQPPSAGPSWAEMLRGGLQLDATIEDATVPYPNNDPPYGWSGVTLLSNTPAVQGGVPNGQTFQLVASIRNVAPAILPIDGGNGLGCKPFLYQPRVTGPNYCAANP